MSERRRQLVVHEDIVYKNAIISGPTYEAAVREAAQRARRKLENFAKAHGKAATGWVIDPNSWTMAVIPRAEDPTGYSKRLTVTVMITRVSDG